ncbi:MAG: PDDEXK nuclease domain-containing protein [Muribaculaceae bacterium]|nr:PDDEXK nuclease domain-containing protein [Muribaculaceae bacterium]
MSKLSKTDTEYSRWIQELKERYRSSQIKAAAKVNREMLRFYWSVGRDIVARDAENVYGSGFYKNLSQDLKEAIPESDGFSRQNLQYMKKMYLLYKKSNVNCQQVVGNSVGPIYQQTVDISENEPYELIFSIPWGHHCTLIDKYFEIKDTETALFYINKTVQEGWSRSVLKSFIETNLHLRQGKALTSFSRLLPSPDSDLAQELTRDPYIFDFTEMTEPYRERELKRALMANISRFLLELGSGFAYVGEEYRLQIGHTEQFIDLLFYNIKLHAYCVIEVKTATFGAGDIGQLGTYMTAVNHILKTEQDNPTIGLLICKDNVLAQYALESSSQPIGVAEFQLTKFIPDEFKSSLPSIEDIELELKE